MKNVTRDRVVVKLRRHYLTIWLKARFWGWRWKVSPESGNHIICGPVELYQFGATR